MREQKDTDMFNNRTTFDASKIVPTSKIALKLSCLQACDNDIARSEQLYDYMMKDLKDLPDTEPTLPSGIQRFKTSADDIIGWVTDHKDLIQQGIGLVQGLRGKSVASSAVMKDVPPIPKI